jgi:hypothetical protein
LVESECPHLAAGVNEASHGRQQPLYSSPPTVKIASSRVRRPAVQRGRVYAPKSRLHILGGESRPGNPSAPIRMLLPPSSDGLSMAYQSIPRRRQLACSQGLFVSIRDGPPPDEMHRAWPCPVILKLAFPETWGSDIRTVVTPVATSSLLNFKTLRDVSTGN